MASTSVSLRFHMFLSTNNRTEREIMTGDRRLGLVTAQSHATHGKTRRGDYRPALAHGWQRRSDSPLGLSELRLNPAFRRKERKKTRHSFKIIPQRQYADAESPSPKTALTRGPVHMLNRNGAKKIIAVTGTRRLDITTLLSLLKCPSAENLITRYEQL